MPEPAARAESSCKRCHRRKKRCDKTLPQCHACQHAKVSCSFLDDETQVASYPVAYGPRFQPKTSFASACGLCLTANRYVRGLERRVKELEEQLTASLTPQHSQTDPLLYPWDQETDIHLGESTMNMDNLTANQSPPALSKKDPLPPSDTQPNSSPFNIAGQRSGNLADELRLLSLEAAAERYLGSSSGLSFAKLTQTVLQRLSPDQEGFMFDGGVTDNQDQACDSDPELDPLFNSNSIFFEMNASLTAPLPLNSIFGNPVVTEFEDSMGLALLDPSHINSLLEFYFAHSHTLYPFIRKSEFETVLWSVYGDPLDPLAQSPLWQFRIWMVLAIGSTTYCSVSLMDETEPLQLFNKAMTYFEPAMGCGDLVSFIPADSCIL